jgi:hypothetical protein
MPNQDPDKLVEQYRSMYPDLSPDEEARIREYADEGGFFALRCYVSDTGGQLNNLQAPDVLRALFKFAPADATIPIWIVHHLQDALDEAKLARGWGGGLAYNRLE